MGDRSQVAIERKPRRSDATFWRDATITAFDYLEFRQRWWRLAGWKKAARVLGAVAVAVLTGWGMLFRLAATERFTAVACGLAAGCGLIRAALWWEGREHRARVRAFAAAIALPAGHPPALAWRAVHVPADYRQREDAEIVVDVAPDFTGAERDMEDITRAVTVKLLPNPKVTKALDSRRPRLIYARSVPPPSSVSLKDIRARIDTVKPSVIVLGLAAEDDYAELDLDSETPMVGVSMPTGEGKSEAAKNMAVQVLYHGGIVLICDYKMVSHMWADGLPNVCYARTPAEIQEALVWLAWDDYDADGNVIRPSELTRRKQVVLAAKRRGEKPPPWPRLLVLAEERNATGRAIRRHHRRMGGKGSPPALESMDETGETGRQVLVNKVDVAQRLSAKASGSDGSRDAMENIGAIITKDPSEQTWKLLGGGHAQPPRSGHKGRYQLITNAGVTEFQGVLYDKDPDESDRIARELAMSGTVGEVPSDMPFVYRGPLLVPAGIGQDAFALQEGSEQAFVVGHELGVLPVGDGPGRAVTCAEMAAAGLFVTKAAARKMAQRKKWKKVVEDSVRGDQYALADVLADLKSRGKR